MLDLLTYEFIKQELDANSLSKGNAKMLNLIKNQGGSIYHILQSKLKKSEENVNKIGQFKLLHSDTKLAST